MQPVLVVTKQPKQVIERFHLTVDVTDNVKRPIEKRTYQEIAHSSRIHFSHFMSSTFLCG